MDTDTMTVARLASEAVGYFEKATRPDGDEFIRLDERAPEWLSDLVRDAHGDLLPDDWRYATVEAALWRIGETDEDEDLDDLAGEFADSTVDVYTGARFAWLSSNLVRQGYVDEARDEGLIVEGTQIVEQVGIGQYMEAREVFDHVARFLTEKVDAAE